MMSVILAVLKDIETEKILLNSEGDQGASREFILHGTRFVYHRDSYTQSVRARGPLLEPIMLMVCLKLQCLSPVSQLWHNKEVVIMSVNQVCLLLRSSIS